MHFIGYFFCYHSFFKSKVGATLLKARRKHKNLFLFSCAERALPAYEKSYFPYILFFFFDKNPAIFVFQGSKLIEKRRRTLNKVKERTLWSEKSLT